MKDAAKQLSNPFSTGEGGARFEAQVQASFVALMLTGGFVPCLPCWQIKKVKLQGKFKGYETDDLVVFLTSADGRHQRKLLGQIKHTIGITERDKKFGEVVQAAWNDFRNPRVFTPNRDAIVLITGPISATDTANVRTILERARHMESCDEFFSSMRLANFASETQRKKLKVFRTNLRKANGDSEVADETAFEFLKHFHLLGYDLDIKAGVTLSLLHSLIGQNAHATATSIWPMLVAEVQSANQHAGTLTKASISEELQAAFSKRVPQSIPPGFAAPQPAATHVVSAAPKYTAEMTIANLLGAWDENADADRVVVEKLAKEEYSSWVPRLREALNEPNGPLRFAEGKWTVADRLTLWQSLGSRVFDDSIDAVVECAVAVLGERDPQFDLPAEERYAAAIRGKSLNHSSRLRKGIAETLSLIGAHSASLPRCSTGKAVEASSRALREILEGADWVRWASSNAVLPLLAEAAPRQFLDLVDNALRSDPCPFDELFKQEGSGLFGANYMTGMLWALETLAWDAEYLTRVVVTLGGLAERDPGGNWANRPENSLTTILLPWLPQTCATIENRIGAVRVLIAERPGVAWRLLLSLLPSTHQSSFRSRKPEWQQFIPEDWKEGVTHGEYRTQIAAYAEFAFDAARSNMAKLAELAGRLPDLPPSTHEKLVEYLRSSEVTNSPEPDRIGLWNALSELVSKHRRFPDAKWALRREQVDKIAAATDLLQPAAPSLKYRRLFREREFGLYDGEGDVNAQWEALEKRRKDAVAEIFAAGGLTAILEFTADVEVPWNVGLAFGELAGDGVEDEVLPALLESTEPCLAKFAGGFVLGRCRGRGYAWVDGLDKSSWTKSQIGQLLAYLPFGRDTWERSALFLGADESAYWTKTSAFPYEVGKNLTLAVQRLLEHGRPHAAIQCLYKILHDKQPVDADLIIKTLLAALKSEEDAFVGREFQIVDLIRTLQDNTDANPADVARVEFGYLQLLDGYGGASPKVLERRLADDPEFFCEVLRYAYRSKHEPEGSAEPSTSEKAVASNAYRLLHDWQLPPGKQEDGSFDSDRFIHWLSEVRRLCEASGHLEVALMMVGHVLIRAPQDPDGLWIHRSVANALNAKDVEDMRLGYRTALFNSRGVHSVTPDGKAERDYADLYRTQAASVEIAGFHLLANTLRELAEIYVRDAERLAARYLVDG